jgi:ZIP family zinc transporter
MLEAGFWALVAASSLVVGAAVALSFDVPRRVVGAAMAFGAGSLIGALAYELIPGPSVSDLEVWISFGTGAVVFYVADWLLERRSSVASVSGEGESIALGALLDGVPESIVLGMSTVVQSGVSVGFLVAVFVSNVPESLSATAEMRASWSRRRIYAMWGGIALVSGVAGALGYVVADSVPSFDGNVVQAFAGGAVLTMLVDSMMPEAVAEGGKIVALLTALGFAVAAILTTLE